MGEREPAEQPQTACELIETLYDQALRIGISPLDFQDMTISQIQDMICAHNEKERMRAEEMIEDRRWTVANAHWLAGLISYAFHEPKKMPRLETAFPELFGDEQGAPKWKRQQAGFAAWAQAWNQKVRKGGSV